VNAFSSAFLKDYDSNGELVLNYSDLEIIHFLSELNIMVELSTLCFVFGRFRV
jgi:hypothetical protein